MKEGDYVSIFENRNMDLNKKIEPLIEGTIVKIHTQKNGTSCVYLNTGYTIEIFEI